MIVLLKRWNSINYVWTMIIAINQSILLEIQHNFFKY